MKRGRLPWAPDLRIRIVIAAAAILLARLGSCAVTASTRTHGWPGSGSSSSRRLVRHPIYSGVLVAGIGTAVAPSWPWLTAVALAGVYFVYSAKVEERYLSHTLPDEDPPYKRSAKVLVPFIL